VTIAVEDKMTYRQAAGGALFLVKRSSDVCVGSSGITAVPDVTAMTASDNSVL